ncbi:serine hydrolase domain-containing protein [Boseongicola aestuarii]|uniref:Penicillin-binding protein 4 n=1 Tax=Boseongicola aestuarii TaxID=1470561 RepID=A0A238IZM3_9RHOB|nr:serine hydrolase domain-containing protein [Boseongicola aestuarii]SMX23837.1 Penicillin-binding protein 4* [Boseongicola aestuarii]
MIRATVIAAVLAAMSLSAVQARAEASVGLAAKVQDLLADFYEVYDFPGATVAVALPDGRVLDAAIGLADVEANLPMTPATRMLAASVGKTIVGALVLSLESEGVLDRDDLISQYLQDAEWFGGLPHAEVIKVRHLLNHSSGLLDHVHIDGVAAQMIAAGSSGHMRPEQAIAFVLNTQPLFEPGQAWSYTDTGYLLLGLVIEKATGRDFYDLASERLFSGLMLDDTAPSVTPSIEGLAIGYTFEGNPFGLPQRTNTEDGALLWNPAVEWTGGGFVSTAHDLARWGQALFTGKAMAAPYLDRLLDGVPVDADAPDLLYGSGVAIYRDTPLGPVYGHGGWIPGYVTSLRHYGDHAITIAFQINTDVGIADDSSDLVPALEAALAELLVGSKDTE